jgi:hypothetical protein
VSVQDRCMVCAKRTIGSVIVLGTPGGTQGEKAQVEPRLVLWEIMLILTQDRCIVYDEHTVGSAIILEAPDETPR